MMRIVKLNLFLLGLPGLFFSSCENQGKKPLSTDVVQNPKSASQGHEASQAVISFNKTEHDFGQIIQGEVVSYSFTFENTGTADLLISGVKTSCGCTVSKYPKEPLKPGAAGKIEAIFDSKGRKGFQNKTITVLSNATPSRNLLKIKAKIVLPENL